MGKKQETRNKKQMGFTLVELIVAMTFFSFMLVLISVGVIQIMRIYQSNLATRRTQQAARIVVEDVTREIRSALRVPVATPDRLCLEGAQTIEYSRQDFAPDPNQPNTDAAVLYKRQLQGNCTSSTGIINEQKLAGSDNPNGSNVQVRQFLPTLIEDEQDQPASIKIILGITTGARDLLDSDGAVCQPGPGAQFCAATTYSSIVSLRGGSQ